MNETALTLIHGFFNRYTNVLICVALFAGLRKLTPCNRDQPRHHRAMLTNVLYMAIIPYFTRFVQLFYMALGVTLFFHGEPDGNIEYYVRHGFGPLGQLPLWLQSAITFILSDIILYWTHRLFHTPSLWPFHAIHHSPKHLEWHSTYRFHPVNVWMTFTLVDMLMVFLGLSIDSILIMGTFNFFYSAMVHANLNWRFGPFRYIFASPVFHRWHHTSEMEGMDKNFAPTFPLLDILFGTFYLPDHLPEVYGVHGSEIPESFLQQLVWPFEEKSRQAKLRNLTVADEGPKG